MKPKIMHKVKLLWRNTVPIKAFEIVRETELTVTQSDGTRRRTNCGEHVYYDDKQKAIEHAVRALEDREKELLHELEVVRRSLTSAKSYSGILVSRLIKT